jgi:hypothetical protein
MRLFVCLVELRGSPEPTISFDRCEGSSRSSDHHKHKLDEARETSLCKVEQYPINPPPRSMLSLSHAFCGLDGPQTGSNLLLDRNGLTLRLRHCVKINRKYCASCIALHAASCTLRLLSSRRSVLLKLRKLQSENLLGASEEAENPKRERIPRFSFSLLQVFSPPSLES